MAQNPTDWVAEKLAATAGIEIVSRTPEDFLVVRSKRNNYMFPVAVLGVHDVIKLTDVVPLFSGATKPKLVVNVPTSTLWSGDAIRYIHAASAAFGTLGDVSRAADTEHAGSYRDKDMGFFINGIGQHRNVSDVSYVYDRVFKADRDKGPSLTVAVIDTYNMSAEDVRNARTQLGDFDIVVKSSSHGSITSQAVTAAESIGAEALTFGGLMGRLHK